MIVGRKIEKLEIPHEPGNFIHVRELSGLEMDDAADITSTKTMKRFGSIGAEAIAAIRSERTAIETAEVDPKTQYDWEYLVTHAITAWSGPNYDGIECNTENKKQLDRSTLEWLVGELIQRNTVPLAKSQTSSPFSVVGESV